MEQERVLRRLQREVRTLAPAEGWWETGVPRMWACRFFGEKVQLPRIQLPYLYLVLDGALRLHTPSGILDYEAGQYSISRIDTPLRGTVLAPSREGDLLALALAFTANQVIEVVLALDRELTERIAGEGLVLSITLVPGKAYTAAVTQCKTKDVAAAAAEGASLMAIQANDPRITLVAGGYPLFYRGKIAGGIGVGGGTEEQDCASAEHVAALFEELTR